MFIQLKTKSRELPAGPRPPSPIPQIWAKSSIRLEHGWGRCYKPDMRDWMREKLMRRRSKRGPNESESTGKSGQELPTNQLAPLRPDYPEPVAKAEPEPEPAPQTAVTA